MKKARNKIQVNQQILIFILMVADVCRIYCFETGIYHNASIDNILRTIALYGIASMGMTLVILTGGADLSAGSNMALAGVIGAGLLGNAIGAANRSAAIPRDYVHSGRSMRRDRTDKRILYLQAEDGSLCSDSGDDVCLQRARICGR